MLNNFAVFDGIKYSDHAVTGAFNTGNVNDATNSAAILLQQTTQQQQPQTPQQQSHDTSNDGDIAKEAGQGKRKHCVWDYYDLINGKASCKACGRSISATTTLAKGHLKAFHSTLFVEVEAKEEHRPPIKRRKTPQLTTSLQQLVTNDPNISNISNVDYSKQNYGTIELRECKMLPKVRLCRTEHFSAAHRLHNPRWSVEENEHIYGKCNNPNGHGHNYAWKVVLEGNVDPQTGMVYNLSDLKREMADVLLKVDHKNLDLDVDHFRNNGIVSTTENLAVYLFHQLKTKLKSPQLLKKVVISETDKNQFSYSGD